MESPDSVPTTPPLTDEPLPPLSSIPITLLRDELPNEPLPPPTDFFEDVIPETPAKPQHSKTAMRYMGTRVPDNTHKASMTALRALGVFVAKEQARDDLLTDPLALLLFTRRTIFPDGTDGSLPSGYTGWTKTQFELVRYFLIEFATNYKSQKTEKDVKPTTMKGYLDGIQRAFAKVWGYELKIYEGPIFNCEREGLISVLDNKFSEQQSEGKVVRSHNVLSREDVLKLFKSRSLSKESPCGFQARLIFGLVLITAMRPSALWTLTTKQFKTIQLEGETVWTICGAIGSRLGASKTNQEGMKAVKDRPTEVCIWNREGYDGAVNLFEDITEYMDLRRSRNFGSDRFFLAVNRNGTKLETFFKSQNLGRNSFSKIVKAVCKDEGVTGSGFAEGMTAHGLRGTAVTLLFESGFSDATVAMRTGHRDLGSLKSYHNLRGQLGRNQQQSLFGGEVKRLKFDEEEVVSADKENNLKVNSKDIHDVKLESRKLVGTEETNIDTSLVRQEDVMSERTKLLSGVNTISGGTFNINVHNHYR